MKPKQKEKAKEILIKMQFQSDPLMFEQAKKCALIAVDEILESLNCNPFYNIDIIKHYKQIKKEIEKL